LRGYQCRYGSSIGIGADITKRESIAATPVHSMGVETGWIRRKPRVHRFVHGRLPVPIALPLAVAAIWNRKM
jgi:hypothetical protein